jgi:hypothetical protein
VTLAAILAFWPWSTPVPDPTPSIIIVTDGQTEVRVERRTTTRSMITYVKTYAGARVVVDGEPR